MLIKRGAEAELRLADWHGRSVVEKVRVPKGYRSPIIDESLRRARVRTEARLMAQARSLGISVPLIYDVDLDQYKIVMEKIQGPTVKEIFQSMRGDLPEICAKIGKMVAQLHKNGIIHGDLTTSNMLLEIGRIYLIDFGLGERRGDLEALGVDLHLLREAFASAHSEISHLFDHVIAAYKENYDGAEEVIRKAREIEERGRYL